MKIAHELCIDHDSSRTAERAASLIAALGNGPNFRLAAIAPDDVVHGRLISVLWCNTRTLGESIRWHDNVAREITADNVSDYFAGQGHKLVRVADGKAYGNTIVHIQVTEADEDPTDQRKTTLARPGPFPTEADIRARIDAWAAEL